MSPIREGDLQASPHINLAGPINHFQPICTKDWSIFFGCLRQWKTTLHLWFANVPANLGDAVEVNFLWLGNLGEFKPHMLEIVGIWGSSNVPANDHITIISISCGWEKPNWFHLPRSTAARGSSLRPHIWGWFAALIYCDGMGIVYRIGLAT